VLNQAFLFCYIFCVEFTFSVCWTPLPVGLWRRASLRNLTTGRYMVLHKNIVNVVSCLVKARASFDVGTMVISVFKPSYSCCCLQNLCMYGGDHGFDLQFDNGSMRLTHKKTVISHKLCTHFWSSKLSHKKEKKDKTERFTHRFSK